VAYSNRLLEDMYVERFEKNGLGELERRFEVEARTLQPDDPKYKEGSTKLVVDERRKLAAIKDTLTAIQSVAESDLLALANARASSIKERLVAGGVDPARIFVLDPEKGGAENGRVKVEMVLTD
jgi:hypothetical protein